MIGVDHVGLLLHVERVEDGVGHHHAQRVGRVLRVSRVLLHGLERAHADRGLLQVLEIGHPDRLQAWLGLAIEDDF